MDRSTLAVVGVTLALIAASLAAAVLVRARATPPDLSTPGGAVLAYAQAERRGDPTTAWDLLAPDEQARLDRDRFLARTAEVGDNTYLSTEDERIDADAAGASVVLVTTYPRATLFGASTSFSTRATVRLVRVNQEWRISVPPDAYSLTLSENVHHP
ncbi:MAG: hypothetical protein JOZ87_12195 [Chloroflexi bacterium]|nr:hypothetical protein [Chloroflexota bacterium]